MTDDLEKPIVEILNEAFGDRPITWFDIADVIASCSVQNAKAYVLERPLAADVRADIEAVLAWRPDLRWQLEWPRAKDETRVLMPCAVERDQRGRVTRIEAGADSRAIRFARISRFEFAIRLAGQGLDEDIGVLVDRQLLPTLPPQLPGEWARVHEDDLKPLFGAEAELQLAIRNEAAGAGTHLALPGDPGAHPGVRWPRLLRGIAIWTGPLAAAVLMAVLIYGPYVSWHSDHTASVRPVALRATPAQAAHLNEPQSESPRSSPDAPHVGEWFGSMPDYSLLQVALRESTAGPRLTMTDIDSGESRTGDFVVDALAIPPEIGRWCDHEPEPRVILAKPMDLLAEDINPGSELVVVRRHRMREAAVVEIRDMRGRLLKAIWNRGYIYDVSEGPEYGTLVIAGSSNSLPQSMPGQSDWDGFLLTRAKRHVHPNFLAKVDVASLPARSGLLPARATATLPRTPTMSYFAQSAAHSLEGLQIMGVRLDRQRGVTTVEFVHYENGAVGHDVHLVCDLGEGGSLSNWRFEDGTPLPADTHFSDLLSVDSNRWGLAIDAVEQLAATGTPRDVWRTLADRPGDARTIAELRAASPVWVLDDLYNRLSSSDVDAVAAAGCLSELADLDPSGWSMASTRQLGTTTALALLRTGAAADALEVVRGNPTEPLGSDPTPIESDIAEALILAHLGEIERAKDVLAGVQLWLDAQPAHIRWLVLCDARNVRLLKEVERLLGDAARPGSESDSQPVTLASAL